MRTNGSLGTLGQPTATTLRISLIFPFSLLPRTVPQCQLEHIQQVVPRRSGGVEGRREGATGAAIHPVWSRFPPLPLTFHLVFFSVRVRPSVSVENTCFCILFVHAARRGSASQKPCAAQALSKVAWQGLGTRLGPESRAKVVTEPHPPAFAKKAVQVHNRGPGTRDISPARPATTSSDFLDSQGR